MRRVACMLALVAAGLTAACLIDRPTEPDSVPSSGLASSSTCTWSPAGPVWIDNGTYEDFVAQVGCGGVTVTINPSSADFGFSLSCGLKSTTGGGLTGFFRVYGCGDEGHALVEIRDGFNLLQTIWVDANP